MMLQTIECDQADRTVYPTSGVRVSINHHRETLGNHRFRLSINREVANVLRRGLAVPRLHIDGSVVNGLRVWCEESGGMAPTSSGKDTWHVTVPIRRVRGREGMVAPTPVDIAWERDETGPVMLIPRLPDEVLPGPVLDKLPNSQVDMSTIIERAEKRLLREIENERAKADQETSQAWTRIESLQERLKDEAVIHPEPEAEPEPEGEPTAPLAPTIVDLKDALAMVNELVDQLGDEVVLSIDATGHVRAKRRIVQYLDL